MRLAEILNDISGGPVHEAVERVDIGRGRQVKVLRNPSLRELDALLTKAPQLRGISHHGDVFLWDARQVDHAGMAELLGIAKYSHEPTRFDIFLVANDLQRDAIDSTWRHALLDLGPFRCAFFRPAPAGTRENELEIGERMAAGTAWFSRFLLSMGDRTPA